MSTKVCVVCRVLRSALGRSFQPLWMICRRRRCGSVLRYIGLPIAQLTLNCGTVIAYITYSRRMPSNKTLQYKLRARNHNLALTCKSSYYDSCNYIARMQGCLLIFVSLYICF